MFTTFFMHIRRRISMNQKTHTRNDQEKDHRELVNLKCKRNMQRLNRYKVKIVRRVRVATLYL